VDTGAVETGGEARPVPPTGRVIVRDQTVPRRVTVSPAGGRVSLRRPRSTAGSGRVVPSGRAHERSAPSEGATSTPRGASRCRSRPRSRPRADGVSRGLSGLFARRNRGLFRTADRYVERSDRRTYSSPSGVSKDDLYTVPEL
jgi:hypothetical protein